MKVFQIENNICYWDATRQFPSVESTVGCFPPDLLFVEAPDNVFEGWGYIDGEFIQPTPPEGWLYDAGTGTFYREGDPAPSDIPTPEEQLRADLDKLASAYIKGVNEA